MARRSRIIKTREPVQCREEEANDCGVLTFNESIDMRATKLTLRADPGRTPNALRTKMTFAGQPDLRRLAHQIANQLTVINLSCFKLRHGVTNDPPTASLGDIERVERAVEEITRFVRTLQTEEDPP